MKIRKGLSLLYKHSGRPGCVCRRSSENNTHNATQPNRYESLADAGAGKSK